MSGLILNPPIIGFERIAGGYYEVGTVLGFIDETKVLTALKKNAVDGSQKPYAILAQNIEATGGAKSAAVYYSGLFDSTRLSFSEGESLSDHFNALKEIGVWAYSPDQIGQYVWREQFTWS